MRYCLVFIASALMLYAEVLWKRFWPVAYWVLAAAVLLLLNVPQSLGEATHRLFLLVFLAAGAALFLYRARGFSLPGRHAIERRMEECSGLKHHPIRAAGDRPAGHLSEEAQPLWEQHIQEARLRMARLRMYTPDFCIPAEQDRLALRPILLLSLVCSLIVAGHGWQGRLQQGFTPVLAFAQQDDTSLDIWVDPPQYLKSTAVFLHSAAQGSVNSELAATRGATLKIRASGYRITPSVRYGNNGIPLEETSPGHFAADIPLLTGGTLTFKTFLQKEQQWQLHVAADTPPTVELVHAGASPTGATKLAYIVKDDHALQSLRGIITAHDETAEELGNTEYFFDIPPIADGQGHEQRHLVDLTPHLWAGKKVNLTLRATDSFDQEATSAPVAFTLPERRFHNPAARRLADERKKLLWDTGEEVFLEVAEAVSQIAVQPQLYKGAFVPFMALNAAINRLAFHPNAHTRDEVAGLLWSLAVKLEDGGMLTAQKELYDALQEMLSALSSSEPLRAEQLQELMQNVQTQMQKYMQAMAQELAARMRQGESMPNVSSALMEKLGKKIDMQNIFDQMQQLQTARSAEELQHMAEQLKRSIENFSLGGQDEAQKKHMEAMESLQDLENIIAAQEALLDKTNKTQDKQALVLLAFDQDSLLQRLAMAITRLAGSLGTVPDPFANAYLSMEQSFNALESGFAQTAAIHQQRALDELKKGVEESLDAIASALQQSMVSFNFLPQGQGTGQEHDPLGRRLNTEETRLPNQSELRRIQQIMDELRKRSNDYQRSQKERDYIERLIY